MIKEAIEKILALAVPTVCDIEGRSYADRQLYEVKDPQQKAITVGTLTSIVDYFKADPDGVLPAETAIVHVASPTEVFVMSPVDHQWRARHAYLSAVIKHREFPVDRFLPLADFMVRLQTHFVESEMLRKLQQVVGNIVDEASVKVLDDGVSQEVTARSGIARVSNVVIPNPVEIAPHRTFVEVEQPVWRYVLRIEKQGNNGVCAGLFDAEGGLWAHESVSRVKAWLVANLPEGTTVLG